MQAASEMAQAPQPQTASELLCYHCGTPCITDKIKAEEKYFCCEGCKLVYELINENDLCDYYKLQSHPGLAQVKAARSDKFAYLDNNDIASRLYKFTDGDRAIVTLYIPSIHCSSCMWLLEHMSRLDDGITESRLNFSSKEVTIHFSRSRISLRRIAELLTTIGYEPYISLDDATEKTTRKAYNKKRTIKLGVAGFCFGNIMMMSFPEYLSGTLGIDEQYAHLFRYLNLALAFPVFFYSASEFFDTAWKGIRQKMLNIDAPIALALVITFGRSLYEILTNTGAGYLDSMSGIVFFMLVGRVVQERTYKSLSFTRDYKAYFPVAVRVKTGDTIVTRELKDLKENDIVVLHHGEIVPADSVAQNDNALIDYSFVTGESEPVAVRNNSLVYAGGRQAGEELILKVVKPVAGSYLTSLWNHYAFKKNKSEVNDRNSAIHLLSQYFTVILFALAIGTAAYWYFHDPSKIMNSVSAMLIVACPCALLLSATFTNGNILRILSNNGLYLRDATVIEQIAATDHIVFDKTGTITQSSDGQVTTSGHSLDDGEKDILYALVRNSSHPGSVAIARWLGVRRPATIAGWKEVPGKGLEAYAADKHIVIGSAALAGIGETADKASVYVKIDDRIAAFHISPVFRKGIAGLIRDLGNRFRMTLLSGDNDRQRGEVRELFGPGAALLFDQKPADKLAYVESLQQNGRKVMMIGDGLNDAGALQQSNVGVTLTDDVNNFTPACDAILSAERLPVLSSLISLARNSETIIRASFVVSVIYNIIGLFFAMRGLMTPVAAAILMPCSTLSIVIISSGVSNVSAWRKGLRVKDS